MKSAVIWAITRKKGVDSPLRTLTHKKQRFFCNLASKYQILKTVSQSNMLVMTHIPRKISLANIRFQLSFVWVHMSFEGSVAEVSDMDVRELKTVSFVPQSSCNWRESLLKLAYCTERGITGLALSTSINSANSMDPNKSLEQ